MNNNIKNILIALFIVIWLIAIIIGYRKGKNTVKYNTPSENIVKLDNDTPSIIRKNKLLPPKPIMFKLENEDFEPLNYSLKFDNMEERITIIDEKGDQMDKSQSESLMFNLFSLNIIDDDMKKEETLQKSIKFSIEKDPEEEQYKGMIDKDDPFAKETQNSN